MVPEHEQANFEIFRDCLSDAVISKLSIATSKPKKRVKGRKNEIKPFVQAESESVNDAKELGDFVEYVAEEIWTCLPPQLRSLCYAAVQDDHNLASKLGIPLDSALVDHLLRPLPISVAESLKVYSAISEHSDLSRFLEPVLSSYISSSAAPPPEHTPAVAASRPPGCEICGREHLPLTYHHLIPRKMHAKAVRRGWHKEWELNKVAWLCRACHSYVHKIADNEELAKEMYSVELLLDRSDVQRWAQWVGRVRWKAR